jgi:hypothetical protein
MPVSPLWAAWNSLHGQMGFRFSSYLKSGCNVHPPVFVDSFVERINLILATARCQRLPQRTMQHAAAINTHPQAGRVAGSQSSIQLRLRL